MRVGFSHPRPILPPSRGEGFLNLRRRCIVAANTSEDFIWVSGHWRSMPPRRPGTPSITVLVVPVTTSEPKRFTVKCPYSGGGSKDPGRIGMESYDCPVCAGTGWLTLWGDKDDYKPCGNCGGSGKERGEPPNPLFSVSNPCHICHGSGLVSVRQT